jgi:predicted DNA-binding transcriptional regulator AlpA
MVQDIKLRVAIRKPAVLAALGESNSGLYAGIEQGIYPPPTKLHPGARNSIWWADEIAEVQARAIARRDAGRAEKAQAAIERRDAEVA